MATHTAATTSESESGSRTAVLGPTSYIRNPVATWSGQARRSPRVVLLFGWLGSTLATLERYSRSYDELFPSATQILIRCVSTTFLSSSAAQRSVLVPVLDKIEELLSDDRMYSGRGVLIHIFSNGGCFQFVTLSDLLRSRPSLRLSLPSIIIFDSCPVRYETASLKRIISTFLPDFPRRVRLDAVALVALAALIAVRMGWRGIGFDSPCGETLSTQWDRLHQPDLCPWFTRDTKRLYLYSRVDPITPQAVVEEHMEEARRRGLDVYQEVFDESWHIFHAKKYPEQYWRAVNLVWDDAVMSGHLKL